MLFYHPSLQARWSCPVNNRFDQELAQLTTAPRLGLVSTFFNAFKGAFKLSVCFDTFPE